MKAIAAIARDENRYLAEWVRHHLDIGFDHILLCDNYSKEPLQQVISELPPQYARRVTVELEPPNENIQYVCYEKLLQRARSASFDWVAFIDLDEFIIVERPLDDILDLPPEVGALYMCWQFYNANGQRDYQDRPVVERFTQVCDPQGWCWGKSIVRINATLEAGVHLPVLHRPFHIQTPDGTRICRPFVSPPVYKDIRVNHYYTKSYQEWLWKIERGSSDNRCLKKYLEFFWYNPQMIDLYDPSCAMLQQGDGHHLPITMDNHRDWALLPGPCLNLGCRENALPGWINSDLEPMTNRAMRLDFTKPFPFPNDCFSAVLCEHSIEHVTKNDAAFMLAEAKRVLRRGGHIRLVTPSVENIARLLSASDSAEAIAYVEFIRKWHKEPQANLADALNWLFYEHGHRHLYTLPELCNMLEEAGFSECNAMPPGTYGHPVFTGVDGHGKIIGDNINAIEGMAVEAVKN